jgi:hypothetical protein
MPQWTKIRKVLNVATLENNLERSRKVAMHITNDSEIPFLDVCPRETLTHWWKVTDM